MSENGSHGSPDSHGSSDSHGSRGSRDFRDASADGSRDASADGARDVPGGDARDVPGGGARDALARAQADLLAALVAGGEAPPGFDRERLRIQEASLISKRRGMVARHRPDLVTLLGGDGGDFAKEFDAYARGRPKPSGGSRADARDFADRLKAAGRLAEPPERPVEPRPPAAPHRWWSGPFRKVLKLLTGAVRPTG
ncbi:hypothetical protein [Streptosporangium sp. NPDC000396]|uniref:hypothetical protein n=1 Tax=Streptosporangium sp. NPDC000396 TaxID=3366185 RepID=UPI00367393AE